MSTLLNQVYAQHLQDLLGPDATIGEVEFEEGMVHFSLLLDCEQDFFPAVNCAVCGIRDGSLECMMTAEELNAQLRLKSGMARVFKVLKNHYHEKQNNPQPGAEGGKTTPAGDEAGESRLEGPPTGEENQGGVA